MINPQLTLIENTDDVADLMRWLGERRPILAIDTETSGLSLARDHLRLFQVGDANHGWAMSWRDWRGVAKQIMATYKGPKALAHAKFDAGMLERDGIPFDWTGVHDVLLMGHLDDTLGPKGLKGMAARDFGPIARAGEKSLRAVMTKNKWSYATVPVELPEYWGYGAFDTVLTAMEAELRWPRIQFAREAYDLEMACARVLCGMELRGARIDVDYCQRMRYWLQGELERLREQLGDLNPNSPSQVSAYLQAAGCYLVKRTQGGALSVDDDVLERLAAEYPAAGLVQDARYKQKMLSGYIDNFLRYRDDDILNSHIHQVAAKTGRMSITDPALQTLPRKSMIRDAFIPREGHRLVLVDYDQEEMRMAGHFANDTTLLSALQDESRDLHMEVARALYGEHATREHRAVGKTGFYAKLYGSGTEHFSYTMDISEAEAQAVYAVIDRMCPEMARTMNEVMRAVRARGGDNGVGWVVLPDGRHIKVRSDKAYVGFNALIQGTCATVLKRSIVDLDLAGYGELMVLPVHDEIIFDIPQEDLEDVVPEVRRIMTRDDFRIPLTVGAKVVDRWGDPYREKEAA